MFKPTRQMALAEGRTVRENLSIPAPQSAYA
jgi:hypothetical protein